MRRCYRCDTELGSTNRSEEHIILNACGGRLKSDNIICASCNSTFGQSFDAELARQTNDLANLLLIKRERGTPQEIIGKLPSTGEDYILQYGGEPMKSKPDVNLSKNGDRTEIKISARSETEFKAILKGLKRKFPMLDVDKLYQSAQRKSEYLEEPISISTSVGGEKSFKAIVKTAINFYVFKNGETEYIKHLIPYLDGSASLDIVWMHYPSIPLYVPNDDEVSHVIHIVGLSNQKILYAYVELFNAHIFLIKLSEEYQGKDMDELYVFDLISQKVLDRSINIRYDREFVNAAITNRDNFPFEQVQLRFSRCIGIAMARQTKKHHGDLTRKAIENSLEKHPDGIPITQEMIDEFINEFTKQVLPYIAHLNRTERTE